MVDLVHKLQAQGHSAGFSSKTLEDLQMDVGKVSRFVKGQKADAWIIFAGPQEILQWFVEQSIPAFALYGRQMSVDIAGTGHRKAPSVAQAIARLVELGHQRIVFLVREDRRKPTPGLVELLFLEELESHGITTGAYNLPDWKSNPKDFHRCLDTLFKSTPPTALLISEPQLFFAAQQHLARRGILAPEHVSLICTDPDPAFHWCEPDIAHIGWEPSPLLRYMLRWVDCIASGKPDHRKKFFKSNFIEGGTMGPAPKR
jgi:DNA-binding LacI/PurR family transcriptional regulator